MMSFKHPAAAVEAFHLAFLEVLRHRLDPARYALKGGANLRFFFDSPRYSEDIDLDAFGVRGETLERQVDAVLASAALGTTLRSAGLAITPDEISKPKQSNTTRRWKVPVRASGSGTTARTKIEFSSRSAAGEPALEAVPDRVVAPYGLRPPTVQHYRAEEALEQKVRALAHRAETQARDVFDLELLLRQTRALPDSLDDIVRADAANRALELPYAAFADQVAPFLDSEVATLNDREAWERMQLFVAGEVAPGAS